MVRDVNLQQRVLLTIRIARGWREADLSEIIIAPVIKELLSAEKAMAPHSSTLTWRIHGQRSLVGCSPWGREESATTEQLHFHFHALEKEMATHSSSCLENPRNRGAWWAAVSGVAQSWTRLK